jgi:hypothetical protein
VIGRSARIGEGVRIAENPTSKPGPAVPDGSGVLSEYHLIRHSGAANVTG